MLTVLRSAAATIAAGLLTLPVAAQDKTADKVREEFVAKGMIDLFDGATTFGWKVDGDVRVEAGKLILGGKKATRATTTSTFPPGTLSVDLTARGEGNDGPKLLLGDRVVFALKPGESTGEVCPAPETTAFFGPYVITVPAGQTLGVASLHLLPNPTTSLFNGKDLSGWKVFQGDPKRAASTFEVTKDGELRVTNGPGDLQTEGKYADFLLQFQCKTNGKNLNSGIFFRCVPDQYQNGYEAQIHNGYKDNDRTKPVDFGTGAIYRRVPARKVVSNDNEWFTMTVLANGPHIATWVNGYQTVDWTDDRQPDPNPRKGLRTAAGHLSIQGHDPTTDILFRDIRIVELKK